MTEAVQNIVASGGGWSVGRTGSGFDVRIDRANGEGYFGTGVAAPATDAMRDAARDRLTDCTDDDGELAAIEAAFTAPWVQA